MVSRIESISNTPRNAATETLVDEVKGMIQRAEQKAVEQAKNADRVVRDHPYPAIGVAFGLGMLVGLIGLLAWRKRNS
jgi:ElaB/YqjD/DUF883 family membrane-anchored ribosome-binding protein